MAKYLTLYEEQSNTELQSKTNTKRSRETDVLESEVVEFCAICGGKGHSCLKEVGSRHCRFIKFGAIYSRHKT